MVDMEEISSAIIPQDEMQRDYIYSLKYILEEHLRHAHDDEA